MDYSIPVNTECVKEFNVKPEHSALNVGSGTVNVLSTPTAIAFVENTALECVEKFLPENYTTVGVEVNIKHLNPAPIGSKVKVKVRVISVNDRRIVFKAEVRWNNILILEGTHVRYIVNRERFLEKIRKLENTKEKQSSNDVS